MATMNRNVNLEEINSDAFMGITYLQHQTILQKVILFGNIIIAIGMNLLGNFYWNINMNIVILMTLLPLSLGVILGCNYNEDLSLAKYFKLVISKPFKEFYSKPTEDLEQLRNSAERIRMEEEQLKLQNQKVSQEEQKKLLFQLLLGVGLTFILLILILLFIKSTKNEEVHHTVALVYRLWTRGLI